MADRWAIGPKNVFKVGRKKHDKTEKSEKSERKKQEKESKYFPTHKLLKKRLNFMLRSSKKLAS